jgi:transcriptional regulator of acetoin/glycerol metabolism
MITSVIDEHLSTVYKAIESNEFNSETDLVTSSWKRCVQVFKLDPLGRYYSRVLTQSELQSHTSPIEEFIARARDGMENLYAQVEALDYVVLLCDKNGITVDYIGNKRLSNELKSTGLSLGTDWNERHAGTCAVGTIINELVPLTIHQNDHFDIVNTSLTCSAAPILDHNGQLLAILDVSAPHAPREKNSQHLLLKLVEMHAGLIEADNFLNYYHDLTILKFDTKIALLNTYCPNLIALDNNNVLIGANQNARKIIARELGIRDITSTLLTGFDITALFEFVITNQKSANQYFIIKSKNTSNQFFSYFQPPSYKKPIKAWQIPTKTAEQQNTKPITAEINKLAGSDPTMHKVKLLLNKFSPTITNILLKGETGTGKELVANAIHLSSNRSTGPFIAVNCAALPDSLIESELFGYKAGSFTGASSKGKSGLILAADKGTLFLDEIGDMPASLQTRLLRVLAEKLVTPIGSDRPISVDFRLISATHQDIAPNSGTEQSHFRPDLYHRLNGATINLPALRDRQDLYYLVSCICNESKIVFSEEAMQVLVEYSWPGNIRELKNVISYAMVLCDDGTITPEHLPDYVFSCNPFIFNENSGIHKQHAEIVSEMGGKILYSLKDNNWNATETAKQLEISRATLYRKMKKYNIISPNNAG